MGGDHDMADLHAELAELRQFLFSIQELSVKQRAEIISKRRPDISKRVSQAARHVFNHLGDLEPLKELDSHEQTITARKPLVIGLLGKAEVGKSYVCTRVASLGLSQKDVQSLEDMNLHGGGTTNSFTTVPLEIEYGEKVEEKEVQNSPVRRITVPSPLLKKFSVRLVDTPGIMNIDDNETESNQKATDATLKYYAENPPDAVWILPSFGNRRPDNGDIALALRHLYHIGLFTCDPVMTPSVTYLLNKKVEREREEKKEISATDQHSVVSEFFPQVKRAIQHVFNLDIHDIQTKELSKESENLKKTLELDKTTKHIRAGTNGSVNAFYHYYRLDCQWFVNEPNTLANWFRSELEKIERRRQDNYQIKYGRSLNRVHHMAKARLCTLKHEGSTSLDSIRSELALWVESLKKPRLDWTFDPLEIFEGDPIYLNVRLKPDYASADVNKANHFLLLPPANSFECKVPENPTLDVFHHIMEKVALLLFDTLQSYLRRVWANGQDKAQQLMARKEFQDDASKEILTSIEEVCGHFASSQSEGEWLTLRKHVIHHCSGKYGPKFSCEALLKEVKAFADMWNSRSGNLTQLFQSLQKLETDELSTIEFMTFLYTMNPSLQKDPSQVQLEILSEMTTTSLKCLRYLGSIENDEFKHDKRAKLDEEMEAKTLSEYPSERVPKPQSFPSAHRFKIVKLSDNDALDIECNICINGKSIEYKVSQALRTALKSLKDSPIVLVPSKKRPDCPMSPQTYPNLFAEEWSQTAGPSVILVVEDSEAQEYREYLGSQLYRSDNPDKNGKYGFVVLMRVSWSDEKWILNMARKRQVMKLLMDTLYKTASGPGLYVTHDDNLKCLKTLSEIGAPFPLTVRSSIKFLQRIMEYERNDMKDDGRQGLILNFLTELMGLTKQTDRPRFWRFHIDAAGDETKFWRKGEDATDWRDLSDFVKSLLNRESTGKEPTEMKEELRKKWRDIVSLHDRVAMVSVLVQESTERDHAVGSMRLGKYTHCVSEEMRGFVLHYVPSTRRLNFEEPDHFFSINPTRSPDYKMAYGCCNEERNFAIRARNTHHLPFMTPLIHVSHNPVPQIFQVPPAVAKRKHSSCSTSDAESPKKKRRTN